MEQLNTCLIQITTTQKFPQIHLKNKRYNWMRRILLAHQRRKQNHKEENLDVMLERRNVDYGISMGLEPCLILGQVSHKLLH